MGFDKGNVTVAIYSVERWAVAPSQAELVEMFAAHAAKSLDSVGEDPQYGWTAGDNLLDIELHEGNAIKGGYLYVNLRKAVKKAPPALLKALCTAQEQLRKQTTGRSMLSRKERKDIQDEIKADLLRDASPTISGIPVVYMPNGFLYVGTAVHAQLELVADYFYQTTGKVVTPLTPEEACAVFAKEPAYKVPALETVEHETPDADVPKLGRDFLMTLYAQDVLMGDYASELVGALAGPLTFSYAEAPPEGVTVDKTARPLCKEACSALQQGKSIAKARIMLGNGDYTWAADLEADSFLVRNLEIEEASQNIDEHGLFADRMRNIGLFYKTLFQLYADYLRDMMDKDKAELKGLRVREWIANQAMASA